MLFSFKGLYSGTLEYSQTSGDHLVFKAHVFEVVYAIIKTMFLQIIITQNSLK